mgnify:CR=1 FL=1
MKISETSQKIAIGGECGDIANHYYFFCLPILGSIYGYRYIPLII